MNALDSINANISRPTPEGPPLKILLIKPPYFTPWTPPLSIAILKAFLEKRDYSVKCLDYNTDPELWRMHHNYFAVLQALEEVSINDGYSKLWWILNAHLLAYANGANATACARVIESVTPMYGIRCNRNVISKLVGLVDRFFHRLEKEIGKLDLSDYAVVGTSTYTTSLGPSLFILRRMKQIYPHITTVMGGGVFADDLALGSDNLKTLIEEYPYIDHVVVGEGEKLFLKLLEGELSHKRVISITDLGSNTLDMKEVPTPDFSDFEHELYFHLTVEGARSCPFQCSFCSETVQWGGYRKKPIDLFVQQVLDLAGRYKNNSFFMGDSLMNPYINSFATELLNRKANILYDGYLRADKPVTNRKFVKLWVDSGLYRVRLGIESAAARVLNSMDKMTKPEVISDVLKTLASEGIRTTTYWIVGFPGETEEDFQETCEFIRKHHRYIYELEAHPYYYYPYGQIGSRLHQCYSIYPEEVTETIKFRVWEVVDANPTREERYSRLRRISSLAASLSLPNIYSMADCYKAEERWHLLHPLVTEVYEGTKVFRESVKSPASPVEMIFQKRTCSAPPGTSGESRVICYHASVDKRLSEEALSESVVQLIKHNEMLQMRVQDDMYISDFARDGAQYDRLSYAYDSDGEEPLEAIRCRVVEELSSEMRPETGRSVRVALITGKGESCDVLLLAHRALVDARSVTLLFEDLFRIYEQLSNNKEISLRPVQKCYAEIIKQLATENDSEQTRRYDPGSSSVGRRFGSVVSSFDKSFLSIAPVKSTVDCGLKPAEVLAMATLRAIAKSHEGVVVDIRLDYRLIENDLEFSVGPLTGTYRLPKSAIPGEGGSCDQQQTQNFLRQITQSAVEPDALAHDASGSRVLLNLEYFQEQPWLGGCLWAPHGFVLEGAITEGDYVLEIVPTIVGDSIRVSFLYDERSQTREIIDRIASALPLEMEEILRSVSLE